MSENWSRDGWSENVILVDADYVDKVAFDLTVNFERMLGRRIPPADMARWLECVALDGGLRPASGDSDTMAAGEHEPTAGGRTVQVVLLHRRPQMDNFLPGDFAQLDGQAFQSPLGEFLLSSVRVEDLVTMDDLLVDSLQVLVGNGAVRRLVVVPDADHIYNKVRSVLRHADPGLHATVLTMQPMEGGAFRQEILGYSLLSALGISGEEIENINS